MIRIPTDRAPTHPGEMLLEEFLRPQKLFNPCLVNSICVRPFQLYGEYIESIDKQFPIDKTNIYFIAENKKIRFMPNKVTVDRRGQLKLVFSVANHDCIYHTVTIPKLLTGNELPEGTKSVVAGVDNCAHYQRKLRKNECLTGVEVNRTRSSEELVEIDLHTPTGTGKFYLFPHSEMVRLDLRIGSHPNILYIGQSKRMKNRVSSHEKIQRALAEVSDDKDIYLYLFQFAERRIFINRVPEKIDYESSEIYLPDINDEGKISLIEMGLINYFKPKYNSTFVNSEIASNRQVLDLLKSNGFSKLAIDLSFDSEFWCFGSEKISPQSEHLIMYELDE